MAKNTLLVLAAGMGSRYGSLKQMDGVGPNNEAIIDYSVYDAIHAGFRKVVFVIRHSFEREFREVFTPERFGSSIEVDFVFQELDMLPEGYSVPAGREKPWGTNHAVMMASGMIKEPFAVINADDFYGRDAFYKLAGFLQESGESANNYCMVGYLIGNTLSDYGSVSRGVCEVNENGNLISMVERTSVRRRDGVIYFREGDAEFPLPDNTIVSMNMFGFTPDYFTHCDKYFREFLDEHISDPKSEFFIPFMVNRLVSDGVAEMKVLETDSQWFGVTYREDKPLIVEKIKALTEQGVYPLHLWK